MKKASKVLLLIAGIVSIVMAILWLVLSIIEFVRAGEVYAIYTARNAGNAVVPPDWYMEYFKAHHSEYKTFLEFTEAYAGSFILTGVLYMVFFVFCIPCAIISFISKNRENKGLFICDIIFGVLSGTGLSILGGIFGLIAAGTKKE